MASIKLSALTKKVAAAIAKSDGQIEWDSLPEMLKTEYTRHATAALNAIFSVAPAPRGGE